VGRAGVYKGGFYMVELKAKSEAVKVGKLLLSSDDYSQIDYDDYDILMINLDEIINKKNKSGFWFCEVENFGWRNLDGHRYLKAVTGQELLSGILPDCQCIFKVFNYGRGLAVQNWHHDSPTGNEWYYLRPISELQYNRGV